MVAWPHVLGKTSWWLECVAQELLYDEQVADTDKKEPGTPLPTPQ
jgi:hypothetical protein